MNLATPPMLTWADLAETPRRALRRFDRLLAGRYWLLIVVVLSAVTSLFFAFPAYGRFELANESWDAILRSAQHPFDQTGLIPTDRAYNFTFRATVPLLGGRLGLEPWGYLVLQALAGLWVFASSATIVARLTGSRRLGGLTAIAVGLTWAGSTAFVEIKGNFDAVAIAFLLGAMASRRAPLVFLFGFLATWTDERAIPALAFVALVHLLADRTHGVGVRDALRQGLCLAAAAAVVAHVASRLAVAAAFDLEQPSNFGLRYLEKYINQLVVGSWTGLEGFWLAVILATAVLIMKRQWLIAAAFAGVTVVILTISMSVTDITRSMAFLLPAAFVAIAVLQRWCSATVVRATIYAALVLCVLWPVYYVGGESRIYWAYPAPMQLLRWFAGIY